MLAKMAKELKNKAQNESDESSDDEEDDKLSIPNGLIEFVGIFINGLSSWGEANGWKRKDTWLLASIATIQSGEYNTLVRKFRKANAFNAYEAWMHSEGKIPEEHRGFQEAAVYCGEKWQEMTREEKAVFEESKEVIQAKKIDTKQGRASAVKTVIHRLNWTFSFMEVLGLSGLLYLTDPEKRSAKVMSTPHGGKYDKVLNCAGLGSDTFQDFAKNGESSKKLAVTLKRFVKRTKSDSKLREESAWARDILGLETEDPGVSESMSAAQEVKAALKESGNANKLANSAASKLLCLEFNRFLKNPSKKTPNKKLWERVMEENHFEIVCPEGMTLDEIKGLTGSRRKTDDSIKIIDALASGTLFFRRTGDLLMQDVSGEEAGSGEEGNEVEQTTTEAELLDPESDAEADDGDSFFNKVFKELENMDDGGHEKATALFPDYETDDSDDTFMGISCVAR